MSGGGLGERLFVALFLPEELGELLAAGVGRALGGTEAARSGFRLPRPDGLHLTLVFLGEVSAGRREALEGALARELAGLPAPRLRLAGTGAFPGRGRERVLWAGVREEEGRRLEELHARTLAAVEAAGLDVGEERHRPFRPHVTVARPRAARPRVRGEFYELEPEGGFVPERVDLVRSERGPGPATYRSLRGFPLERG